MAPPLARFYHALVVACVLPLFLLPERRRWRMLLGIEAVLRPVARRLVPVVTYYPGLVPDVDQRLFRVLERATRIGLTFVPQLEHGGAAERDAALARGTGMVCVGMHADLIYLAARYLSDRGRTMTAASMARVGLLGTRETPPYVQPVHALLLRLRRALERGEVVLAMIDRGDHPGARTMAIGGHRIPVAPQLFRLAARDGVPLLYFNAVRSGSAVRLDWGAPRAGEDAVAGFERFLCESFGCA